MLLCFLAYGVPRQEDNIFNLKRAAGKKNKYPLLEKLRRKAFEMRKSFI